MVFLNNIHVINIKVMYAFYFISLYNISIVRAERTSSPHLARPLPATSLLVPRPNPL